MESSIEQKKATGDLPTITVPDTSLPRPLPKKNIGETTPSISYSALEPASDGNTQQTPMVDQQLSQPSISIRDWIMYLPHPRPQLTPIPFFLVLTKDNPDQTPSTAHEPTSTVVLTSPRRTFIDLRFFKPRGDETDPLPNHGERSRLEWAFAGRSESWEVPDPYQREGDASWPTCWHAKWQHWLDSRHDVLTPHIPVDEGDMYPVSEDRVVEIGAMYQPALDQVTSHEEMWLEAPILPTNATPGGPRMCVVLRCHNDKLGVRGLVIRLGQYIQGILMSTIKESCTVERWEFDFEARDRAQGREGEVGEVQFWRRTARVGDLFLPCLATVRLDVGIGGTVKYEEFEWSVEEACRFDYASS